MEEQQYWNQISQENVARNPLSNHIYNGRHKNDKIKKELVKTKPVFFVEEQNHHVVFSVKVVGQIYHGNVAEQETCSFFSSDIQVEISDDNEIPINV